MDGYQSGDCSRRVSGIMGNSTLKKGKENTMKITVNKYMFERAFVDANRKENFSRSGLFALFEYLEELEQGADTETELDVIGLCCDFSEYASATEAATEYGWEKDEENDEEENEESAREWLNDRTQVISHKEGVIVASF